MNGCLAAWLPCLAIIMGAYFVSIELFFDRQTEIKREIWSLPKEFRGCTFDADADVVYCVSCLFIYSFVCLWISCYLNPVYILPQNDYIPSCWNRRSQPASDAQIENAYNSMEANALSTLKHTDQRKWWKKKKIRTHRCFNLQTSMRLLPNDIPLNSMWRSACARERISFVFGMVHMKKRESIETKRKTKTLTQELRKVRKSFELDSANQVTRSKCFEKWDTMKNSRNHVC